MYLTILFFLMIVSLCQISMDWFLIDTRNDHKWCDFSWPSFNTDSVHMAEEWQMIQEKQGATYLNVMKWYV